MLNRKDYRVYYSHNCNKCFFNSEKGCTNKVDLIDYPEMSCVKDGRFTIFKLIKKEKDNA